jgi:hypothetical protein
MSTDKSPDLFDDRPATPLSSAISDEQEKQIHAQFRAHRAGINSAAPVPQRDERHWIAVRPREEAIAFVTEFFGRLLNLENDKITRITEPTQAFYRGDIVFPAGTAAEIKARPIDPGRYPLTRVEIADLTFDPRQSGGAAQLAHMLSLDAITLADITVHDYTTPELHIEKLGTPDYISLAITSMVGATVTVFANKNNNTIYVYTREEIMGHIRRGLLAGACRRGEYPDRPSTLTLLIPLPRWRFTKDRHGFWRFTGIGVPETEKRNLRNLLTITNYR